MGIHKHHSTPRHMGGHGPIQLLEDRDHAYIHFHRFVSGEDPWFHGNLLKFLEPWDQITVRELWSLRASGEGNPMYGVPSPVTGWSWWTDGETDIMSEKQPGQNFKPGRTNVKGHDALVGQRWFNNGTEEVLGFECPEGFITGRIYRPRPNQKQKMLGRKWWNNGDEEVFCHEQPDGYVRGRLPKG
jgi:hypothetical protein